MCIRDRTTRSEVTTAEGYDALYLSQEVPLWVVVHFCIPGRMGASSSDMPIINRLIYQILLDWKQYEYCYEILEFPNPRPTQPKKNWVKSGFWALKVAKVAFGPLFPTGNLFSWVGIGFV